LRLLPRKRFTAGRKRTRFDNRRGAQVKRARSSRAQTTRGEAPISTPQGDKDKELESWRGLVLSLARWLLAPLLEAATATAQWRRPAISLEPCDSTLRTGAEQAQQYGRMDPSWHHHGTGLAADVEYVSQIRIY
jgi:hypothetical protein